MSAPGRRSARSSSSAAATAARPPRSTSACGATAARRHARRDESGVRVVSDVNLVLGGSKHDRGPHGSLRRPRGNHGIRVVRDTAHGVDAEKRTVRLASGSDLPYDRLVLSPGHRLPLRERARAEQRAGAGARSCTRGRRVRRRVALRRQLEAMRDGGVYAHHHPACALPLPARAVRARLPGRVVLQAAKPKSKVLILDGNPDVTSKTGLFKQAWSRTTRGIVEYRPNHVMTGVDVAHEDREVRDRRRRQGRRAQRDPAAARRQHRARRPA